MPNISPDFDFPGAKGLFNIVEWVLGGGTAIAIIALIICIVGIAFKGFGHSGYQQKSASAIIPVLIVVAVLGSFSAVFQFAYGFDFLS